MKYIKFFEQLNIDDVPLVGGKNASLGEMVSNLQHLGINVPNGFAITSEAYWYFIKENNLEEKIEKLLLNLDIHDIKNLQSVGEQLRELIKKSSMPTQLIDEINEAYQKLSNEYKDDNLSVAVRSSATAEDLPDASFAGQQDTFLNISGEQQLCMMIQNCFASLFNNRAISYRQSRGYNHMQVALSVGVQKMVRSDKASSGVMFTIDTHSGNSDLIMINSIYGIGENIVSGKVTPDDFHVFKPTLKKNHFAILKRKLGDKKIKMIHCEDNNTKNILTSQDEQDSFSINDEEVMKLAQYGVIIEEHYSNKAGTYRPMDIEWAKDEDGTLYIVQARPETVQSQKLREKSNVLEEYYFVKEPKKEDIILEGIAVGNKIGSGTIRIINNLKDAHLFQEGEILVTDTTDPDWEPIMKKASAVVTNRGGRTCHAAIIAREIGVPTIVGTKNATHILKNDSLVTLSCSKGDTGYLYEGSFDYEVKKINLDNLKETKTKLYVNVGDPRKAFTFAKLPAHGVGLARMEFIINNHISCHPMALANLEDGNHIEDEEKIQELIKGYSSPKEYFVQKLAEGISTIVAAFYPRPVIVRTSDFKSNEYKSMLGGEQFEKDEENPMIGFRGASRYYSEYYKEAFEYECKALRFVRDEMGLTNLKPMIPFVRTPDEGRKVIEIMNNMGLVQGDNGLEIYAMCEIPSNVIFADEFLKVFDGYSIGSNDLTQLMLGVDRDSELISHIFDERNEAVKRVIKMAIDACKKENKYIGICGQAPSDYPEITQFLVENNIDTISLNPDSIIQMWQVVSKLESN